MTRFRVSMTLVCPTNWIVDDCKKYLQKLLITKEEKASLIIEQVTEDKPDDPI